MRHLLVTSVFLFLSLCIAFEICAQGSEVLEIESEIGIEDIKGKSSVPPAAPAGGPSAVSKNAKSVITDIKPAASNIEEDLPLIAPENTITDEEVVAISSSLRKMIEENDALKKKLSDIDQQLRNVRGESTIKNNRLTEMNMERDALRKQVEAIATNNSEHEKQMQELRNQLSTREQDLNSQIVVLQTQLAQKMQAEAAAQKELQVASPQSPVENTESSESVVASTQTPAPSSLEKRSISVEVASASFGAEADSRGQKVMEVLTKMQNDRQTLIKDEAKVHYNMGNTYFNQGEYMKALKEYQRTLELTPEDYNAHYNLAFVSGEFLNDQKTALRHYRQYLFLNPGAEDSVKVQQKIVQAEIGVRTDIEFSSRLNEDLRKRRSAHNELQAE